MTKRKTEQIKQQRVWLPVAIAGVALLLAGGLTLFYNPAETTAITINAEPISTAQLAQGKEVYDANCADCHGPNGQGQPNWKQPDENGILPAPPHNSAGHTWHHPDELLLEIITNGNGLPDSAMPAFGETLSRDEMVAALAYIKTFWGSEELQFQIEVTNQDAQFN